VIVKICSSDLHLSHKANSLLTSSLTTCNIIVFWYSWCAPVLVLQAHTESGRRFSLLARVSFHNLFKPIIACGPARDLLDQD